MSVAQLLYLKDVVTLALDRALCVGCGACLEVCPREVLTMAPDRRVEIQARDRCMECGACARNCPTDAVTVRAGVGCAEAVLNQMLGRSSGSCCCVIEEEDSGPSGPASGGSCC